MAKPNILVLAQHAPRARRLGVLLSDQYDVTGLDSLPESGEINADVVLATRLTAQEAVRLRCALLQIPGAGLDGIPLGALPPGRRVANVFGHEIPMAEYVVWAMLDHCVNTAGAPATLHARNRPAAYNGRLSHASWLLRQRDRFVFVCRSAAGALNLSTLYGAAPAPVERRSRLRSCDQRRAIQLAN